MEGSSNGRAAVDLAYPCYYYPAVDSTENYQDKTIN